jgi:predicted nucleic acid-binding protein
VNDVVLDANVLVRLVIPGDYEEEAEALWDRLMSGGEPCVVPSFCPVEVISSLRQMGRGGLITPEREEQAFEEFETAIHPVLITFDNPELLRPAWELARDLNERHTYDSVYLSIARAFSLEFWTADRQLLRRLDGRFPEARFLGDYPLLPPPA